MFKIETILKTADSIFLVSYIAKCIYIIRKKAKLISNIDSNSKFAILKKLLALFKMEDELLIKYLSSTDNETEPNRFGIRKKYWQQILPLLNHTNLFENVSPSKDHWLSTGAGVGGLAFTLIITKSNIRIELGISTSSKEKNKVYF
jgi:hypothetical protein